MTMSQKTQNATLELVVPGRESLSIDDTTLAHLRPEFQVADISILMPGMRGKGMKVAG